MKLEVVTRPEFENLETRVFDLESKVVSADNPDVRFLQDQLDKLVPAHKCISVVGFEGSDASERSKILEGFLKEKLPSVAGRCHVEHICKGKWNERKLAGVSLLEFPSKSIRDDTLRLIKSNNLFLAESNKNVRFDYAKTKRQLHRNACVHKACDMLKQDEKGKGQSVVVDWKNPEKGKRTVSVAGTVAFIQAKSDMSGRFVSPFDHLHFE